MKPGQSIRILLLLALIGAGISSCSPKYGCPSSGKNVGAERILSGEKLPKSPKFKA